MTEKIQKLINDSPAARWTALILIALMMFFGYMFVDLMSPLQSMIEAERGWSPTAFGTYAAGEYILNVCGFLIIAGIILDKCGIRFTGTLSASLMFIGACIKFMAVSDWFQGTGLNEWLNSWWVAMPGSAKMAALGFMIFGCGCEMAGITVSRAIAKWFEGKEMALAMGLEMAIARVGVFAIFSISPWIATHLGQSMFGKPTVVASVAFCTCLLLIGLIFFLVFCVLDKKFDKQLGEKAAAEGSSEEEFKVSDIGKILSSQTFWVVALLCVLYYSAIFPFQRYGANMLQCNLGISASSASNIFRWFPIGAAVITPFLGNFLDRKGKGATMLIFGALLLIICHLIFAFLLPATNSSILAYATIVILGVSFALVPAALWPSVPKIMDPRYLGSAYSLIFWVQNIGLCLVPVLIGSVLSSSNADDLYVNSTKSFIENYKNTMDAAEGKDNKTITFTQAYESLNDSYNKTKALYESLPAAEKTVAIESTTTAINETMSNIVANKEVIENNISNNNVKENIKVLDNIKSSGSNIFVPYRYTTPLIIFASFGILALLIGLYLKVMDRKKHLGLEEPNIKK